MRLFSPQLSLKEQTFLFKRLSFLVAAHITLLESLQIVETQSSSKKQRTLLQHLQADISQGQSLSRSLAKFPDVFSSLSIAVIKVGEKTGTLGVNLRYLADELTKKQMIKRKVISACIYPAVIAVATVGIVLFLILYLFPKITPLFISLHAQLPLSTRIVLDTSIFLRQWGLMFLLVSAIVIIGTVLLIRKNKTMQFLIDKSLVRFPFLGEMFRMYQLSNIARTLGLLLMSGVTLSHSLNIAAESSANSVYQYECNRLAIEVESGSKMSDYLTKQKAYFPPLFGQLVLVGERSGTLSETLLYIAELYDGEVDSFTKNLSTIIEPILMIFMGMLVGFIAISIISPIYGITQNLHS